MPLARPAKEKKNGEAGAERQNLRRPDGLIVALQQTVICAGREEQQVGEAIAPPLFHQSAST
jgi:hypothetical protein